MHNDFHRLEVRMRPDYRSSRKSQVVVAAALAMLVAAPVRLQATSNEAESRMELVMTPRSSGRANTERAITSDVMAYRFRIESAPAGAWSVTIVIRGPGGSRSLHLSNEAAEITLPRPLGLMLRAADTVTASASYDSEGVEEAIALHIDYEPSDRVGARLAVMPVHAEVHSAAGDTTASWRFTADVGGRVLALAGLPMQRVHRIALVDEASGETLWSTTVNRQASRAYCATLPRLGVTLEAGRAYRVDVVFTEYVSITHLTGAVAMVLPQLIAKQ
jgi:hypothetical protein